MTHSINLDPEHQLVIVRFQDTLTEAEFLAYLDELEALGPFDESYRLLMLLDEELELRVPTDIIRTAAKRPMQFSQNAMRVIVAPMPVSFGLSRIFSTEAPRAADQYSIVKSVSEAATLLDIPDSIEG